MPDRIVCPEQNDDEARMEETLRPATLDDFIGQNQVKTMLRIAIEAALRRRDVLDHVLLSGPPGLGKTTLAHIIANELGVSLKLTSGPVLDKKAALAGCLTELQRGQILFIDEVHRLNRLVEECLYPAMEDFKIEVVIGGEGAYANTVNLPLEPFTLVGATTRSGMLTGPLRDRFGVVCRLGYYNNDDIFAIVKRSARILSVTTDEEGAWEIARRSRRTPRVANRLLRRVRDYAEVRADGNINRDVAREGLQMLEVDEVGLESLDRLILSAIIEKFDGGPVGLKSLAVAVGEDVETIEEVYEPFLIQEGFMHRTPQGRVVTERGYAHMGHKPKERDERTLF
ncbi:MAG TPA: Holliday junction branch migration DNA helicase RuvB [bacterium]|nr:Holliday junction branch migration DNA helicase RuvB [bacterium]